ncbi:MAG: hypothetical protein Q9206_000268 [Seirophora lacunosa]
MTSRRIVSDEQTILQRGDGSEGTPSASEKSDIAPAVPTSTWAGATAALTANLVLIAYVIVAMREDQSEKLAIEAQAKKSR